MLRLENVSKYYYVGNEKIKALKRINLSFRKNEFVSILGPSGCGKTTFLNIIGGLDKYSKGDLFINGKSTKEYTDRDWDVYRNHRVGFIFQSYNLIPHQTILENVELALTISGVSKAERRERAKNVLIEVGLEKEINKKPNQLSGGQCQRVAIARALVNNPEILLADEPTGALDTVTSKQIMNLIKKISKDRLVIMVTHNPELAEEYSTRIINLLDGWVVGDSNVYYADEEKREENILTTNKKKKEKAKMSAFTAFRLSTRNLRSKFGRSVLVSFAGSIGIIGVSMVLAFSGGIHNYINSLQDDLLSGYPLTIEETGYDISSLTSGANSLDTLKQIEIKDGKINVSSLVGYLMGMTKNAESMQYQNNITREYIDYLEDMPEDYYSNILYGYDIDPINNLYTGFKVAKGGSEVVQSLSSIIENYKCVLAETDYNSLSKYIDMFYSSIQQAPNNKDYILSQYDLLDGKVATSKDEIMVVINPNSALTDVVLAELGYFAQDEFLEYVKKCDEADYNASLYRDQFDYSEILNKKLYYCSNNDIYSKNEDITKPGVTYNYNYIKEDSFENVLEMKVVGILKPKENISYGCLDSGFYYTEEFTNQFLKDGKDSEIVNYLKDKEEDSFTSMSYNGMPTGVSYDITYNYENVEKTSTCYVGESSSMASYLSMFGMGGSSSIKTLSIRNLGGNDLANSISIYPVDFENKDLVTDYLDLWNSEKRIEYSSGKTIESADRSEIKYTDTIGLIIGMINTFIDIVSYALIAFTALSLVVSTVMIGIITYVSVVERVKEIGVIRSLGGRKLDVSNLFVAETFIIGLTSGLFGIGITYFNSFILNSIFKGLIGFGLCSLSLLESGIMILISVMLTLISGIIPARSAARQDPVVSLRTE